jgi:hypothetical protein
MKSHLSPLVLLVTLVSLCGSVQAQTMGAGQVAGPAMTPGMTPGTPLGDGAPPTGAVGVPLGSTELGVQGLSPAGAGTSMGSVPSGTAACPGMGSAAGQSPAPMFDGGGVGTSGMDSCMTSGITPPAGSSFTAAGTGAPPPSGTGIPLGSVEMAPAGLSPPPPVVSIAPSSVPSATGSTLPCTGGTTSMGGTSMDGTTSMGSTMPMASGGC